MSDIRNSMLKKYTSFIKEITPTDKIVICYDQDGDGIPAAVLMIKALDRLHIPKTNSVPFRRHARLDVAEDILKHDPDYVFILDVSAEEYPEFMSKLTNTKVMIIDHHKTGTKSEALILKPENLNFEKSYQYPTVKLVYDLMSELVNLEDVAWLVTVGLISDASADTWYEFMQKTFHDFKFKHKTDWIDTTPGMIAQIINSATSVNPKRTDEALDMLLNKSIVEILKSSLAELNHDINAEIKNVISNIKPETSHDGKLNIVQFKPKYAIGGVVSNKLSFKEREKTFIVMSMYSDHVEVSARNQNGDINCSDLLKLSIKEFEDSNAGGHKPASGAAFPIRYLEDFKKNLESNFLLAKL
jgi:single-stranded DNA-specific DHH superfamily exonuclease